MRLLFILTIFMSFTFASVGNISVVRGNVLVLRGVDKIKAFVGQGLEKKDTIITDKRSNAQIIFNDDTSVNIGRNSSFSIEEYLVDNETNSQVSLRANKGAIRVITGEIGKIAPKRFKLSTKTSTIGIRGTNFLVLLRGGGESIYCSHGKISVTSSNKVVNVLAGEYVNINPLSNLIVPKKFSVSELKSVVNKNFRAYKSTHSTSKTTSSSANKAPKGVGAQKSKPKPTKNKVKDNSKVDSDSVPVEESAVGNMSEQKITNDDMGEVKSGSGDDSQSFNNATKDKLIVNNGIDKPNLEPDSEEPKPIEPDPVPEDPKPIVEDKSFVSQNKVATYTTKGQKFEGQYLSADVRELDSLGSGDFIEMTFDFGAPSKFLKKMDGYVGGGVETSYIKVDGQNSVAFDKDSLTFGGGFGEHGELSGRFSSNDGKFIKNGKIINKNSNEQTLIDAQFEAIRKSHTSNSEVISK